MWVASLTRSAHSWTFSQATWNTPGFREYHRRMQLFILLYIEAGSYINDKEDSWEFVVLWVLAFSLSTDC